MLTISRTVASDCSHQQYLAKNPGGYCGIGGTGVSCPIGVAKTQE
jgi:peptide-methionine (S)-S-oxide reductase